MDFDKKTPHTTWYGSGPPDDIIGKNRDYYEDTKTGQKYGPKENGHWPSGLTALAGGVGQSDTTSGPGSGGVTRHDDLTGRDSPDNHPWAATQDQAELISAGLVATTVRVDDLEAGGTRSPYLEGARLVSYGDSQAVELRLDETGTNPLGTSGAGSVPSLYPNRLSTRYGMSPSLRHQPGACMDYVTQMFFGGADNHTPWRPGTDWGVLNIDVLRNTLAAYGDPNGGGAALTAYNAYIECLKSMLRWARASPPTSATVGWHTINPGDPGSGVWASGLSPAFPGGQYIDTTNAGDYKDITFDGNELLLVTARRVGTLTAGLLEVVYNPAIPGNPAAGSVIQTIDCGNAFPTTNGFVFSSNFYTHCARISATNGLVNTTGNVVRVRKKTGDANVVYLTDWATPWTRNPECFVGKAGQDSPNTALTTAPGYAYYAAGVDTLLASAEFSGYCHAYAPLAWDPTSMTDSRTPFVHRNDKGHRAWADGFDAALRAAVTTWRAGVHSL